MILSKLKDFIKNIDSTDLMLYIIKNIINCYITEGGYDMEMYRKAYESYLSICRGIWDGID